MNHRDRGSFKPQRGWALVLVLAILVSQGSSLFGQGPSSGGGLGELLRPPAAPSLGEPAEGSRPAIARNGSSDDFRVDRQETPASEPSPDPIGDAPTPPSLIPDGGPAPMAPAVPASAAREMSPWEKTAWSTVKALASTAGSTVGASVGMVAVPAAVTAIVGALGISTAGGGFVAGVLIPATPVIGKILGSAIGAGLFSGLVAVGYEIRMQRFRPVPRTAREIAVAVAKTAATEAVIAPLTAGLGGGAANAAGQSLKPLIISILKKAGIRIAGETIIGAATRRITNKYLPNGVPVEPPPGGTESPAPVAPPAGLGAGNAPTPATGPIPLPPDAPPQGSNPLVNHAFSGTPVANAPAPSEGGDGEPAHGFSAEIERAARISLVAGPLIEAASVLSGNLGGGLVLRLTISLQLYQAP